MIQNIAKLLWFIRLCIFTKRKSNACVTWLLSSNVILALRAKWFRKRRFVDILCKTLGISNLTESCHTGPCPGNFYVQLPFPIPLR